MRPPRHPLLDTNVLLLLYVGLVDPAIVSRFKRTRMFAPEDFALLREIVSTFQRVVTTPHILTEVSNCGDQLVGLDRDAFWQWTHLLSADVDAHNFNHVRVFGWH